MFMKKSGMNPPPLKRSSMIRPSLRRLRVVALGEALLAADRGVGQVQVADLAVGELVDLAAVVLHPGVVAQVGLAGDGHDRDLAAVLAVGVGPTLKHHLLADLVLQQAEGVRRGRQLDAVDRQQVVARRHLTPGWCSGVRRRRSSRAR